MKIRRDADRSACVPRCFAGGTWTDTRWFGAPTLKCPADLWIYQELVHELAPDLIIETGTADGGSGLFLATLCEAKGRGEVVSIDIEVRPGRPSHDRLTCITASLTDPSVVERLALTFNPGGWLEKLR